MMVWIESDHERAQRTWRALVDLLRTVESAYRNDEWNAVRMMLRQSAIRRKLETLKTEV